MIPTDYPADCASRASQRPWIIDGTSPASRMTDSQSFWAAAAAENVDDVISQASLQLWVGETSESIMTRFVQHCTQLPLGYDDGTAKDAATARRDELLAKRQQLASQHSQISAKAFRAKVVSLAMEAGLQPIPAVSHPKLRGSLTRRWLTR